MAISDEVRAKLNAAKAKGLAALAGKAPSVMPAAPRPAVGKLSAAEMKAAMAKDKPKKVVDYTDDPEGAARAAEKARLDATGGGLSGATKEWAEKFKAMNDTEFWLSITFPTAAVRDVFVARSGLGAALTDSGHYNGHLWAETLNYDLEAVVPAKPRRLRVRKKATAAEMKSAFRYRAHPSALDSVEYTGDLEADTVSELEAIRTAFDAGLDPAWAAEHADILDSPHWVTVFFRDRDHKDKFVRLIDMADTGDKYLSGLLVSETLGIPLDPE